MKRTAVRLIVVAGDATVLLVRYDRAKAEGGPFWVPPGGAVEPGETFRQAARRELREEATISADIGSELWDLTVEFHAGGNPVVQTEKYFLVRLNGAQQNLRNTTAEPIAAHRWWSIEDLSRTDETLYPEGLVDRLRATVFPAA